MRKKSFKAHWFLYFSTSHLVHILICFWLKIGNSCSFSAENLLTSLSSRSLETRWMIPRPNTVFLGIFVSVFPGKSFITILTNFHKLCSFFHSWMNDRRALGFCFPTAKIFKLMLSLLIGRIVFFTREKKRYAAPDWTYRFSHTWNDDTRIVIGEKQWTNENLLYGNLVSKSRYVYNKFFYGMGWVNNFLDCI